MWRRKKERRKIIPNIVDNSFRSNAKGQHTHSARTNNHFMNPIVNCKEQFLAEKQLLTLKSGKIEVTFFTNNIVFLKIGHIVLSFLLYNQFLNKLLDDY